MLALTLTIFLITAAAAAARTADNWRTAVVSAYSARSTGSSRQGCPGAPPLNDHALSVATFLIGCGQRMRLCLGRRCVTVTRWDSGPYAAGRQIDVNIGVARALGFRDEWAWGVRTVTWRPL